MTPNVVWIDDPSNQGSTPPIDLDAAAQQQGQSGNSSSSKKKKLALILILAGVSSFVVALTLLGYLLVSNRRMRSCQRALDKVELDENPLRTQSLSTQDEERYMREHGIPRIIDQDDVIDDAQSDMTSIYTTYNKQDDASSASSSVAASLLYNLTERSALGVAAEDSYDLLDGSNPVDSLRNTQRNNKATTPNRNRHRQPQQQQLHTSLINGSFVSDTTTGTVNTEAFSQVWRNASREQAMSPSSQPAPFQDRLDIKNILMTSPMADVSKMTNDSFDDSRSKFSV